MSNQFANTEKYSENAPRSESKSNVSSISFNVFACLNTTPEQNDDVCIKAGFAPATAIADFVSINPPTLGVKVAPQVQSPEMMRELLMLRLSDMVENMPFNKTERSVISLIYGIVRQIANYAFNAEAVVDAIKRAIASASEAVDISKIVSALNVRLYNSELAYASVGYQIKDGRQIIVFRSHDKQVLMATLNS